MRDFYLKVGTIKAISANWMCFIIINVYGSIPVICHLTIEGYERIDK